MGPATRSSMEACWRRADHAVQPGESLEVRVSPGHKGLRVTEVLRVEAAPPIG